MGEQAEHDPVEPVRRLTDSWVRSNRHLSNSLGHLYKGVTAANRAFLSSTDRPAEGRPPAEIPELAGTEGDWEMSRSVERREDLAVGDTVRFTKLVTDEDIRSFAAVSGDTNRLHLDDEFAVQTRFGGRIAHGTLVSGLISAALARLPGLTIYLSQDLEFLGPVDVGERLTAVVEIVEDLGDDRYRLTTDVRNGADDVVVDGEAIVVIDALPE